MCLKIIACIARKMFLFIYHYRILNIRRFFVTEQCEKIKRGQRIVSTQFVNTSYTHNSRRMHALFSVFRTLQMSDNETTAIARFFRYFVCIFFVSSSEHTWRRRHERSKRSHRRSPTSNRRRRHRHRDERSPSRQHRHQEDHQQNSNNTVSTHRHPIRTIPVSHTTPHFYTLTRYTRRTLPLKVNEA